MRPPDFWHSNNPLSRIIATLLSPLSALYGYSVRWKQMRATPHYSSAKVICVGNLTVGGAGKTPTAMAIARILQNKGFRVTFLTRGHGGSTKGPVFVSPLSTFAEVGDEALLLSRTAPTVVSANRAEGARLAEKTADVIIMDDGFQNFQLHKDFSFIVVDAGQMFGNGHILPAGPLREPVRQGMARADAVVTMGKHAPEITLEKPVFLATILPESKGLPERAVAFAGIGIPEKFLHSLQACGVEVAAWHTFADHHPYSDREIGFLRDLAKQTGAPMITTEKDWVRLTEAQKRDVLFLSVSARFQDNASLEKTLDGVMRNDKTG